VGTIEYIDISFVIDGHTGSPMGIVGQMVVSDLDDLRERIGCYVIEDNVRIPVPVLKHDVNPIRVVGSDCGRPIDNVEGDGSFCTVSPERAVQAENHVREAPLVRDPVEVIEEYEGVVAV
jgi:hypothetical protein